MVKERQGNPAERLAGLVVRVAVHTEHESSFARQVADGCAELHLVRREDDHAEPRRSLHGAVSHFERCSDGQPAKIDAACHAVAAAAGSDTGWYAM